MHPLDKLSGKLNRHEQLSPFKYRISANTVHRDLRDGTNRIGLTLQPIFVSRKLDPTRP